MDLCLSKKRDELLRRGMFLVDGRISFSQVETLADWIRSNEQKHDSFTLLISSQGGSPSAVVWFSAFLRTLPQRVRLHGVAVGECGSAAFALLQLCHWRAGVRGTGFFVHRAGIEERIGVHEIEDLSALQAKLERTRLIEDELVRMQCLRIGCSHDQWYKWASDGEDIPSNAILVEEAKVRNFIDRIITRLPI